MKSRSLIESFKFAIDGLSFAFKTERNLRIQAVIGLIVIVTSISIDLKNLELLWIFFAIVVVIGGELLNTVIEKICDLLSEHNYNSTVKVIKDISAGLVLTVSVFSIMVGVMIFGKRFLRFPDFIAFFVYGIFVIYFLISSVSKKRTK
ncbi:MAG TPA: diacylglycerol kinase family protein [Thermotogaceae bacterium]|nr:diacylglycerol kinase family protein [Thermotogota bacterium]HEW91864.1 diacylglycerol kinase family protein [Thermotogaceae bacterium]